MRSDRFAEAHAPLFQPPKTAGAGALTQKVAGSLPEIRAPPPLDVPVNNFIDKHIFGKMQRDGIPMRRLSTDHEFLRRVTLDLTGRIPAPDEVREFVADPIRPSAAS